jgi:hypothetical protein
MALVPLKPAPSAAQVKAATAVQPAAPQRQSSAAPDAKDYTALVAAWMDEVETSAPPPSTLAFSIHMRRQAARLVELLGG